MTIRPSTKATQRLTLCAATAADLMTANPMSIPAVASLQEAAKFLSDKGFGAAPVIDEGGRPVGVVSISDIISHDREALQDASAKPEFYASAELDPPKESRRDIADAARVRNIMTPAIFSVPPEMPAHKVIEAMLAEHVHRLFVVGRDGVLAGVISTVDILRRLQLEPASPGGKI